MVCQQTGDVTLDQIVLWKFHRWGAGSSTSPDYFVRAWSLTHQASQPFRHNGRWLIRVRGVWYSSLLSIETFTDFDPEMNDRRRLPENQRK